MADDALTRPDYQLVMTAAKALAAETDTQKATKALLASLERITTEQKDTSRDPRVAILTRLTETGTASDEAALRSYLTDWDAQVAGLAAKAISQWTGTAVPAAPRLRPAAPLDVATLDAVRGRRLRIPMSRGGTMDLRLFPDDAPVTVARVVTLARNGYYNGLTFRRVEPTFVLQGGSPRERVHG